MERKHTISPEVPGRRGDVPCHYHRQILHPHGEACKDMFPRQVRTTQVQGPRQTSLHGAHLGWDIKARRDEDPDLRRRHGPKVVP